MRWLVHVLARLAITATCTNSAAAFDAHVEPGKYLFSTTSLREHLMPDSSEFVNGLPKRDSIPDSALRADFAEGNLARVPWLELVDTNSPPATIPDDLPVTARLSSFMEGFLLFGVMMHLPGAFPFEPQPTEASTTQPEKTSARERRASIALVSSRTSFERTEAGHENACEGTEGAGFHDSLPLDLDRPPQASWLIRSWSAITNRWAYWDREREIKKAVAALAEFDDRTLRDMGIPSRSQIEQIVRYCREC
jgi:uncharacterized protein YjiS (DUF1127 family)